MAASIQGIYIALFGRPADPLGLAFFNEATQNGTDLTAIGDLASTAEYQDRFAGMSYVQVVNSIYQSLFGRDPEPEGLAFYVQLLLSGEVNINWIAIHIMNGAQGDDLAILNNKIVAANLFTAGLDTDAEIEAYVGNDAAQIGRDFLSGITSDPDTIPTQPEVDAAILLLFAPGEGQEPGGPGGGGGGGGGVVVPPPTFTIELDQDGTLQFAGSATGPITLGFDDDGNLYGNREGVDAIIVNGPVAEGNISGVAGSAALIILAGTLTLTADQADGRSITGEGAVNITGSGGVQIITVGTTGKNMIEGGLGADVIMIGEGADTVVVGHTAVATSPSTAEINITSVQAADAAAAFSITIGGTPVDVDVSGATDGASLATLVQTALQAEFGADVIVEWENDLLTITDAAGRQISDVSLMDDGTPAVPTTVSITNLSNAEAGNATSLAITIQGVNNNQPLNIDVSAATNTASLAPIIQTALNNAVGSGGAFTVTHVANSSVTITDASGRDASNAALTGPGVVVNISITNGSIAIAPIEIDGNIEISNGSEAIQAAEVDSDIEVTQGMLEVPPAEIDADIEVVQAETILASHSTIDDYDIVIGFQVGTDQFDLPSITIGTGTYNAGNQGADITIDKADADASGIVTFSAIGGGQPASVSVTSEVLLQEALNLLSDLVPDGDTVAFAYDLNGDSGMFLFQGNAGGDIAIKLVGINADSVSSLLNAMTIE